MHFWKYNRIDPLSKDSQSIDYHVINQDKNLLKLPGAKINLKSGLIIYIMLKSDHLYIMRLHYITIYYDI